MKITTRAEARERGHMVFFSGEECPQGHVAERYTRSGTCVVCARNSSTEYMKKYRKTPQYLEYQRLYQRRYQKKLRDQKAADKEKQ